MHLYTVESRGAGRVKYTLNERDPGKALRRLEDFVTSVGPLTIDAIVVDIDRGTLLLYSNQGLVIGVHYPVLTCGVPRLAIYVKKVFDVLLWGDYFDYIDIAGSYRLLIEAYWQE